MLRLDREHIENRWRTDKRRDREQVVNRYNVFPIRSITVPLQGADMVYCGSFRWPVSQRRAFGLLSTRCYSKRQRRESLRSETASEHPARGIQQVMLWGWNPVTFRLGVHQLCHYPALLHWHGYGVTPGPPGDTLTSRRSGVMSP